MTKILILILFTGVEMTLDAEELYGITTIEQCREVVPNIQREYPYARVSCVLGDITQPMPKA
jgi:hypothetical protein